MKENKFYTNIVTTNVLEPKIFLLDSPVGKEIMLNFSIDTSDGAIVEIFENAEISQKGNPVITINTNRNDKTISGLLIFEDPDISKDGNQILIRANKNPGNIFTDEIVLKSGTKYQLKITPLINNSILTSVIKWIEL